MRELDVLAFFGMSPIILTIIRVTFLICHYYFTSSKLRFGGCYYLKHHLVMHFLSLSQELFLANSSPFLERLITGSLGLRLHSDDSILSRRRAVLFDSNLDYSPCNSLA
ncbi:hypothetical protein CEXT_376101 [Caerostris extrusa]|uniref:Uncharacterized protein n=1 Tax=Caerostris extrusa TaxID=172846 RepID=A0AAV4V9H9_CAEEX|nr:hypothetical protein CEXT_376101 [Caerostris extrusa]